MIPPPVLASPTVRSAHGKSIRAKANQKAPRRATKMRITTVGCEKAQEAVGGVE